MRTYLMALVCLATLSAPAWGGLITFGDQDCLGFGCYGATDPTGGATTTGLTTDMITLATNSFGHGFPFTPGVSDFAHTDQIFVGSTQTGAHDGYSVAAERLAGPAVFVLDYSSLVGSGETVLSITLGIAADDFQFPSFGQPFVATVNGSANAALTNQLNAFNQGGPLVQFFTIGLNPSADLPGHILTLSIDNAGDGGDGFAVDFLTVGVTTAQIGAVPEPSTLLLVGAGSLLAFGLRRWRH